MDKFELRRLALLRLVNEMGRGGRIRVANAVGKTPDYISRMLYPKDKAGKKGIGEDSVELLNKCFPGWLETQAIRIEANEQALHYGPMCWPFVTVSQEDWERIPIETRKLLETQIKSVVPTSSENRKSA